MRTNDQKILLTLKEISKYMVIVHFFQKSKKTILPDFFGHVRKRLDRKGK